MPGNATSRSATPTYMGAILSDEKARAKGMGEFGQILFPNTKDRGTHVNVSGAVPAKHAPNKENALNGRIPRLR